MATMRQIAAEAGVSMATVSRALKNGEMVSEDTLQKILDVKRKLETNSNACNIIGALVAPNSNSFYHEVLRYIEIKLRNEGYTLISILNGRDISADRDMDQLCSLNVKAILWMTPGQPSEQMRQKIKVRGVPLVQIFTKAYEDIDSIIINDEEGGYQAARNLIQAGHKKIMFIGQPDTYHWHGFIRAFTERGLEEPSENALFVSVDRNQVTTIRAAIQRIQPTAVFTHTELVTIETIQACKQMNLAIPKNISMIAYDDYPWMSMMEISAISHPMSGIANNAYELLLNRIQTGTFTQHPVVHLTVEPRLISRNSVRILR